MTNKFTVSVTPMLLLQHIKMSSLKTKRGEECIIDSHGDVVCKVRMDKLCVKLPFCPFYSSMKDNVPHSIFPFFSLFRFYLETFTLRFPSEISIRSILFSAKILRKFVL